MNEYSIGVLDDGINGFLDHWVQRHAGLESGAFALSCFPAFLMVIPAWAKICKNSNEFAKIQVNPTKSNQIRPLFLFQLLTPKFWLSLCSFRFRWHVPAWRFRVSAARVFDAGARRTTAGATVLPKTKMGPWCRSSTVTLVKNMKITKRTQFKNRTTRHPSPRG
jgi:hypothetical protein